MLISNFNLCKAEWLELVFAKRNKEYGAYYLRQHYADNVVKAMGITFFSITAAAVIIGFIIRPKVVTERIVQIDNTLYKIPSVPPKAEPPKAEQQKAKPAALKPAAPVNAIKFVPPVVMPDRVAEQPPTIEELKDVAVGPVDVKNGTAGTNAGADAGEKGGTGTGIGDATTSGEVFITVENMPEPIGGNKGWTKFLQNTLRYPSEAIDKEIAGRVLVSFIVEKDGQLSNIKVERGVGYGMDEEAARVLKMAHPWKPGMQNGHPVRVKLVLPINFSLGE